MNITKKPILLITTLLAGIALATSHAQEAAVETAKDKKPVLSPVEKTSFNFTRNGQHATLEWRADVSGGKVEKIYVLRNTTGTEKGQRRVAVLPPDAVRFVDFLPDENAYWYWIRLVGNDKAPGKDKTIQDIGPGRVGRDTAGSSNYVKMEDKYPVSVTRNDYVATLKWNLPEDIYAEITVLRYNRPVADSDGFLGSGGKRVLTTPEGKSLHTDTLPNPNADYWYWFRITSKSGAIIYRGPLKAVYARR